MNVLFKPLAIIWGLLAGTVAKKIFTRLWGLVDDEAAPQPQHRAVPIGKLVFALLLEGAVVRVVRGLADHGLRQGVAGLTGSWPGPERPEDE
jgi:hypothetical protein